MCTNKVNKKEKERRKEKRKEKEKKKEKMMILIFNKYFLLLLVYFCFSPRIRLAGLAGLAAVFV